VSGGPIAEERFATFRAVIRVNSRPTLFFSFPRGPKSRGTRICAKNGRESFRERGELRAPIEQNVFVNYLGRPLTRRSLPRV
jgi:hypothetical protein